MGDFSGEKWVPFQVTRWHTHRPLEVDGEPDEFVAADGGVVAHDGRHVLAEGALGGGVDRLQKVVEIGIRW